MITLGARECMTEAELRLKPTTHCPRCGYDLSGAVDSWTERCPVEGVCSECGLQYEWRNVLNPMLTVPRWSFEHAKSRSLRAGARSVLMSLRPRRLWRSLQLQHPVQSRRLWILLVVACLGIHLTSVAGASLAAARNMSRARGMFALSPTSLPSNGDWLDVAGFWTRIVVVPYYNPSIGLYAKYGGASQFAINGWLWMTWAWMLLMPISLLLLPDTLRSARIQRRHLLRTGAYCTCAAAIVTCGALAFRIWTIDHAQSVYTRRTRWGGLSLIDSISMDLMRCDWLVIVVGGAMLCVCWWFAIGSYLRLSNRFGVVVILMLLSLLAAVALTGFLPGGAMWDFAFRTS